MAVMQRQPETTAKKDKTKTTAIARISILTPFVKERKNVCFCVRISLLYHISHPDFDETFLLQDEQVQQKDVTVDNACYPKTVGGSTCDLDSTLYATWVLSELGEEVHTIPYLEERLNEISQKQLNLALLYMITKSPAYATQLADRQTKSGSWIDEVYTTSFASFALLDGYMESYVNATVWLNLKRDKKDFRLRISSTYIFVSPSEILGAMTRESKSE